MNAQDYLKQAADAVRQAATARKHEVDELRKQSDQYDQEYKARIADLKQRETLRLAEAARSDSSATTANRTFDAQMLTNEEAQVTDNYNHRKRDLDNEIAQKQRNADDLANLARTIDREMRPI